MIWPLNLQKRKNLSDYHQPESVAPLMVIKERRKKRDMTRIDRATFLPQIEVHPKQSPVLCVD